MHEPVATVAGQIRRRLRTLLTAWGVTAEIVDDALLVVEELVDGLAQEGDPGHHHGAGADAFPGRLVGDARVIPLSALCTVPAAALTPLALPLGAGLWALLYNRLLLTAVNPALAQSRGVKTKWIEYAFVSLVAVAVMLSIRWVGVLLINALLILPAAAARNVSRTAAQHALLSVLIGLLCGVAGLVAAYYLDTGVGAAVVLCAACCYSVTLPLRRRFQ